MLKRVFIPFLLLLLLICIISVHAAKPTLITVNGTALTFDVSPIIVDNRVLAPIRVIGESLGANVQWDENSNIVIISNGTVINTLKVDSKFATKHENDRTNTLEMDVAPVLLNGRVLVPLRYIAESFGAIVSWDGFMSTAKIEYTEHNVNGGYEEPKKTIKITGMPKTCYVKDRFTLNVEFASFDENEVIWKYSDPDIATVDKNGNVIIYAPGLCTITALSKDGSVEDSVYINAVDLTFDDDFNIDEHEIIPTDSYISSNYFKDDFLKMKILHNGEFWANTLNVSFKSFLNKDEWFLKIIDLDGNTYLDKQGKLTNSGFEQNIDLSGLEDNAYSIFLSLKNSNESVYIAAHPKIQLNIADGKAFFLESPMLKHNINACEAGLKPDPSEYLQIDLNENEKNELLSLTKSIIGNEKDDYKKIRLIHDWVAENIYYDWDGSTSSTRGDTTAFGTYKNNKSVCEGFAELTNVLVRLTRIPCRIVLGYVRADDTGFDNSHAWNEAYVNGRWVIIDVTSNSGNVYQNGMFIKNSISGYIYFDPTIETFSIDHEYTEIYRPAGN